MKVLQVCAYAADYEGNFLNSLFALEKQLNDRGDCVYYAFPETAQNKKWCSELSKRTKVFFLPLKWARIIPKTYLGLRKFVKKEQVDIIHSHFELYDIPCSYAASKKTKVFWHLHDPIIKQRKATRNILNKLQYSFFSKKAFLISVCDYYKDYVVSLGFKRANTCTIVNGIDLNRICYPYKNTQIEYDFLTFGWDFYRKGSDLIFCCLKKLNEDGYDFKLLFNCNEDTLSYIDEYFGKDIPQWLEIGMPVKDVNSIFSKSKTFIQASRRETFSYAVCEAAYAGMNVISSDIPGLEWAHSIPTVSFFENENEDELYKLLKYSLKNNSLKIEEIEESRRIIALEYSKDIWAKKIIEKYCSNQW